MPSLEQIKQQIAALPNKYIFYTGKEIRYLPNILAEGETILGLTSGFMDGKTWLALVTSQRVIFLNRGWLYGLQQVQVNLDRIVTIESEVGLLFGTIRVVDAGSAMTIGMVYKPSIAPFVKTVQQAMDAFRHAGSHATAARTDVISELERLAKLRAEGHVTDEEFAAAKRKLLAP